jgi:uncharacterized protein YaaR (DUF327 family)
MIDPSRITAASRRKLMEERKRKKETTTADRAKFNGCMDSVRDKSNVIELNKLIQTIEREGERLSHFRSMAQLDHYKKKVQEFMSKANRATFKVKATGFTDGSGDYSAQLVVEKVDKALEDLTTYVFSKESQPMQILNQLDLIKGLLTDLYQ